MLFLSIIILIICKALINDKLSEDFYHRISAIILLFSGLLSYNIIYNLDSFSGIGIYNGLFNITTPSQNLEDFYNKTFGTLLEFFANFIQPVKVDYSNEVLATQINDLSIVLFILSVLIIFLLIAFLFNIIILINSDRILNFFTNKYIRAYINFNKKIISIEVILLGGNIIYFMYNLSYGIHFIATHPISFTNINIKII